MPSCMYIIAPASAMHHLAGIERDDDRLKVVADQLVVDFVGHWELGAGRWTLVTECSGGSKVKAAGD